MGWGARFVGVLVAGAVLAGCGGGAGPEPQVLSALAGGGPAVAAKPTATPTTATPTTAAPATATPTTAAPADTVGAEAFVRRWIELANAAFASGEVGDWVGLNAAACKSCAKRVEAVRATYGAGGRIEGGQLEIRSLAATPVREGEWPFVLADVAAGPERHVDSAGALISEHGGGPLKLVFYLDWRAGGWRVTEIRLGVPE